MLTIEAQARVALVGDRHQLAAVGRGGVLHLAVRAAEPAACLTSDAVHRFGQLFPDELGAVAGRLDAARADQVLTEPRPDAPVARIRRAD